MRGKTQTLAALLLTLGSMTTVVAQTNSTGQRPITTASPTFANTNYSGPFNRSTGGSVPTGSYYAGIDNTNTNVAASSCGDSCDTSCDSQCGSSLGGMLGVGQCSPWKIGGWTQVGYHDNNVPLSFAYNDLLSFQDVPDQVHLNQQWLYLERTASRECGFGLGGRMDVIYGTDAQKTQAFGNPGGGVRNQGNFDASWDNGEYGWAIPQLYAELANCNLSIKVGRWFTPAGYERVPSKDNFFYSHSYTQFNSQAFTHTGVLATYNANPCMKWYAGWGLGWDTGFDQLNQGNLFVGGFSRQLTDRANLSIINTFGNFGWRDGGNAGENSRAHSVVLKVDATCRLQYVLQSDLLRTNNPGISTFDTFGLTNYLFYQLTDNIRVGNRLEWWKADGISFNQITSGLNIALTNNLMIRPEYRHDFSPGIDIDEDTFGIDAIWSF